MKSVQNPWGTPLLKYRKTVDCLFDSQNEDFYYGAYKIKLIVVIQGSMWNYFCETFICEFSAFRLKFTFHILEDYSLFLVKTPNIISTVRCGEKSLL